jgi:hypothetical protein
VLCYCRPPPPVDCWQARWSPSCVQCKRQFQLPFFSPCLADCVSPLSDQAAFASPAPPSILHSATLSASASVKVENPATAAVRDLLWIDISEAFPLRDFWKGRSCRACGSHGRAAVRVGAEVQPSIRLLPLRADPDFSRHTFAIFFFSVLPPITVHIRCISYTRVQHCNISSTDAC